MALTDAVSGVRLFFEGFGILRRERELWALSSVPVLFSFAAVALAVTVVTMNAGDIHALVTDWMPALEAPAWYAWIWIGPARLLFGLLGGLLFLAVAAASVVAGLLVANLAASPFLDSLAQRVEARLAASVVPAGVEARAGGGLLREAGRSLVNESRRLAFFLGVWVVITGAGLLVPGGQLVAGPALIAFTVLFLPLEYAGFALDRRQVSFRARRSWIWSRMSLMAGFGGVAFAAGLVPGLNLLLLPVLVISGTLLALRHPPASDA